MEIEFDNATAWFKTENPREDDVVSILRERTKVMVTGAEYTPAFQKWKKSKGKYGWDGRAAILGKKGDFPTGLLPNVVQWLWQTDKISPVLVDGRSCIFRQEEVSVNLRGYQVEAINAGMTNSYNDMFWPRGIFHHATGGGKTEIAVAICERMPIKTLFIVDKKSLAVQTIDRFNHYGIPCGKLFAGQMFLYENIVVATIQTLISKCNVPEVYQLLQNAEQVFFDEAHGIASSFAKGNSFVQISSMMPNAFYRWGLTATPFMKDRFSNMLLAGATGAVLHSKSTKELIDEGVLVPPEIHILKTPKMFKCPNKWPDCYDMGIILNKGRTNRVIDALKRFPSPAIVLVKEVSHLKIIAEAAQKAGLNGTTLQGDDSLEVREIVLDHLKTGRINYIITTLFGTGFDFPTLATVIIAKAGKSEIATIQNVGRGLRKPKGKTKAYIIDFYDESSRTLKNHSEQRIETYEAQGHTVNRE